MTCRDARQSERARLLSMSLIEALIKSGAAARPVLAGGLAAAGRSHDENRPLLPSEKLPR